MGKVSPTQRAIAHCKKHGYVAAVVERWNPYANIRQDMMGFCDLVVLRPDAQDIAAVQVTSGSNVASRVTKIKAEPRAKVWLECGGVIEVWGYRKLKPRGQKRPTWELRVVPVTLDDFAETSCAS